MLSPETINGLYKPSVNGRGPWRTSRPLSLTLEWVGQNPKAPGDHRQNTAAQAEATLYAMLNNPPWRITKPNSLRQTRGGSL